MEFRFLSFVLNAFPSTLPPIKNGCSTRRKGEDKTREDKTMNTNRKEQWKTIKGCSEYKVSDKGRFKKLDGEMLNLYTNPNTGYVTVWLRQDDGKWFSGLVHRIVAETFLPNPNNLEQVDHKDGCRTRNCVSNLRWTTRKFNNSRKRTKLLKS